MKPVFAVVLVILGIGIGLLPGALRMRTLVHEQTLQELGRARAGVESAWETLSRDLVSRLEAFAAALENDRDFAMKLLVERDPADPAVTQQAPRAMPLLGFDVLGIADEEFRLLSSGHFPPSAGTVQAFPVGQLGSSPQCLPYNIRGESVDVVLARTSFSIAGSTWHVFGGYRIDSSFAARLVPWPAVRIVIRGESGTVATFALETVSEPDGMSVIINDTTWRAAGIELPTLPPGVPLALLAATSPGTGALQWFPPGGQ